MARHPITTSCLAFIFTFCFYKSFVTFSSSFPLTKDSSSIYFFSLSFITIFLLFVISVGIYRITLHPLAQYPGPCAAALTDWYTVYRCLSFDRHLDFYRLHERYGPIVRFGPNRISINTNTALKAIYGINANTQKSQVYSAFSHFFKVPATMTTIDKKRHAFKRRVTVQAMNPLAVKGLEGLMLKNINFFLHSLVDEEDSESTPEWSEPKEMTKAISWLLSDIMGDVTFSRNWNMQRSEENRPIIDLLSMGTCLINMAGHMPTLLALKLDTLFFPKLVAGTHQFKALSEEQSGWRVVQKALPHKDLFASLMDSKDPETGLGYSDEDLIAEAGILIVAGSDTTATTLTSTLFYLLHNPSSLSTLTSEILEKFQTIEEIGIGPLLTSCCFLFACVDEALRLSPPVGAMLPREILSGGLTVDDNFFPAGIDIGVPTYSIHHNSTYYTSPFTYLPSRWLESSSSQTTLAAKSAFCAFGVGRTSCVGQYLAYQEIGIILARMIWLYEMRLKPGSSLGEGSEGLGWGRGRKGEFQLYDKFTSSHEGPLVEFRHRLTRRSAGNIN